MSADVRNWSKADRPLWVENGHWPFAKSEFEDQLDMRNRFNENLSAVHCRSDLRRTLYAVLPCHHPARIVITGRPIVERGQIDRLKLEI